MSGAADEALSRARWQPVVFAPRPSRRALLERRPAGSLRPLRSRTLARVERFGRKTSAASRHVRLKPDTTEEPSASDSRVPLRQRTRDLGDRFGVEDEIVALEQARDARLVNFHLQSADAERAEGRDAVRAHPRPGDGAAGLPSSDPAQSCPAVAEPESALPQRADAAYGSLTAAELDNECKRHATFPTR